MRVSKQTNERTNEQTNNLRLTYSFTHSINGCTDISSDINSQRWKYGGPPHHPYSESPQKLSSISGRRSVHLAGTAAVGRSSQNSLWNIAKAMTGSINGSGQKLATPPRRGRLIKSSEATGPLGKQASDLIRWTEAGALSHPLSSHREPRRVLLTHSSVCVRKPINLLRLFRNISLKFFIFNLWAKGRDSRLFSPFSLHSRSRYITFYLSGLTSRLTEGVISVLWPSVFTTTHSYHFTSYSRLSMALYVLLLFYRAVERWGYSGCFTGWAVELRDGSPDVHSVFTGMFSGTDLRISAVPELEPGPKKKTNQTK